MFENSKSVNDICSKVIPKFKLFWVLLPFHFSKQHFSQCYARYLIVRKSGAPTFKPGAVGWEVRMLPVCHATPTNLNFSFVESAPVGTYYDRFIYFLPLYDWYLKQTSKQSAHQIYCCCQIKKKFWTDSKKVFLNERIFCNFWIHCSRKMHLLDLLVGCLSANFFGHNLFVRFLISFSNVQLMAWPLLTEVQASRL